MTKGEEEERESSNLDDLDFTAFLYKLLELVHPIDHSVEKLKILRSGRR